MNGDVPNRDVAPDRLYSEKVDRLLRRIPTVDTAEMQRVLINLHWRLGMLVAKPPRPKDKDDEWLSSAKTLLLCLRAVVDPKIVTPIVSWATDLFELAHGDLLRAFQNHPAWLKQLRPSPISAMPHDLVCDEGNVGVIDWVITQLSSVDSRDSRRTRQLTGLAPSPGPTVLSLWGELGLAVSDRDPQQAASLEALMEAGTSYFREHRESHA